MIFGGENMSMLNRTNIQGEFARFEQKKVLSSSPSLCQNAQLLKPPFPSHSAYAFCCIDIYLGCVQ